MRFVLVYAGPLSASGNKSKPQEASEIREKISPQLQTLWDTHHALQVLKEQGFVRDLSIRDVVPYDAPGGGRYMSPRELFVNYEGKMIDLCAPITVHDVQYKPLVRKSLYLTCELDILFLRQQDPGELVSQGGDIDNRIKTLLDALRMPSVDEQSKKPPTSKFLHCLMESDTLVSRLNVDTDRLLFPKTAYPNEVHLIITVSLNLLRVMPETMCLV